ncbi:MAG: sodium-dependent transporter [Methanomicrobiales archaeon]|nr:sodium-dependent transporter [Methanomicrobiales archaeon]
MQAKERWSGRMGFILAAIGSAVGIGNIWRFPSVVGQNGGGAYLVPYLIAVFLCAFPLMVLEVAVGRTSGGSLISAFRARGTYLHIAGWFVTAVIFLILSYYLAVTGWSFAYAVFSAVGIDLVFGEFTGSPLPLLFFLLSVLITGAIVSFGVRSGIERISRFLIPLCLILLIGLVAFSLTLGGFQDGLKYLFTPDFAVLSSPFIWAAALGQAFFSLSVGEGILTTYGAYLDRSVRIPSTMLIVALADLSVSLMAGLVIFPVVFTFGLEPSLGAQLAFSTLPRAFQIMPLGRVFSLAFFALLFFAALTSAISMLEVAVAALVESISVARWKAALILTALLLLVGLPSAMSYSSAGWTIVGTRILDLLDESVGTLGLILSAILTSIVFAWRNETEVFRREIGGDRWIDGKIRGLYRYAIPPVLIFVFVYRILADRDIPALHLLPDIPFIGTVMMLAAALLFMGAILAAILLFCWGRECRRRGWRRQR